MSRNSTESWRHLKKGVDAFRAQSRLLQTWEIVDYILSGSFGVVFKVRNRNTREYGALKFVANPLEEVNCKPRNESDSDNIYYNFKTSQKEAQIMFQFVGNPRIVQYLEIPEYLSREFINPRGQRVVQYAVLICMKLYQGYDGSRFIGWKEDADKDLATRLQLGCDIAQALMTFEEMGIYHRDVKPGNILRDENGRFVLGDVGEAKKESEASSVARHGTRRYMAPEVSALDGISRMRSDYRSDIYSLGIVLYEGFNHGLPFLDAKGALLPEAIDILKRNGLYEQNIDSNEAALRLRNCGVRLPAPQGTDDEITDIILKACAFRPDDRYQTAAELYHDLNAYARNHGIKLPIGLKHGGDDGEPHRPISLIAVSAVLSVVILVFVLRGFGIWSPIDPIPTPEPIPTPTRTSIQIPTPTAIPTPTTIPTPVPTATLMIVPDQISAQLSQKESINKKPDDVVYVPMSEPTREPDFENTENESREQQDKKSELLELSVRTGVSVGAAGNSITATVTVENGRIIACRIDDEQATRQMREGYDFCTQALIGKECSYVNTTSEKTLTKDIREYMHRRGYGLESGGYVHRSISNGIKAIKDALK